MFERETLEDFPLPVSYIIDVNHDCNFDCKMCVKRTMKEPFGQRPFEDFKKLVDKLPWARSIAIGALGDPFCYRDIKKALDYLHAKKIESPLTTNASLLTEDNIKLIPNNNKVHISIDEGHEKCEDVRDKIRRLRRLRPDVSITINHLLMRNNMDENEGLIRFCAEINAAIVFFYPMYFSDELEKECSVLYLKDLNDRLVKDINLCKELNVGFHITINRQNPCFRGLNSPIIAYDGTVYPCDYVYQNIENTKDGKWKSWIAGNFVEVPQDQYNMGNLYEEDFIDIWNKPRYRELRRKLMVMNSNPLKESMEQTYKNTDLNKPLEHCKICLARWGRCL